MVDMESPSEKDWKAPERKPVGPEKLNIHTDVPNQIDRSILSALIHFAGGEVTPVEIDVLMEAVAKDTLKTASEEYEIATGQDFRRIQRKIVAMAIARAPQRVGKPMRDEFEVHSIILPCGHSKHVSDIEITTTCNQDGRRFGLLELVPLIAKLLDEHTELKNNSTRAKSRFDIFSGLRGK